MTAAALIGVDGGASGVRAARVRRSTDGDLVLDSGVERRDLTGERVPDAWIAATTELLRSLGAGRPVRFGMGMPGRKTADGRGIECANHGPTDERFLDRLADELRRAGVEVEVPCARLEDDGLLGCAGEIASPRGALRGVANAYYLGCGTGVAEAIVLDGRALALEEAAPDVRRAWELDDDGGTSFEERLSVAGLNRAYESAGGAEERIEQGLARGEEAARRVVRELARALERLVSRREAELAMSFDRVVVAQRLAVVLTAAGDDARALLEVPLDGRIALSSEPHSAILGAATRALDR